MEPVAPELPRDHVGAGHGREAPLGLVGVAAVAYHVAGHQSQPGWDSRATSSLYTAFVVVVVEAVAAAAVVVAAAGFAEGAWLGAWQGQLKRY